MRYTEIWDKVFTPHLCFTKLWGPRPVTHLMIKTLNKSIPLCIENDKEKVKGYYL
jgi:hypothetical protein